MVTIPENQKLVLTQRFSGSAAKSYMPSDKDKREAAARNKVNDILEAHKFKDLYGPIC